MIEQKGLFTAGAVPIPNRFFDEYLPVLSEGEVAVLLVVLRSTLGWREGDGNGGVRFKIRDWLTHAQLMKRSGKSSGTVSNAVGSLTAKGLIITEALDGTKLETPEMRRRHIGRVYFRPGDMWITPHLSRMAQTVITTDRRNNNKRRPVSTRFAGGPTASRTSSSLQPVARILADRHQVTNE